MTYNPNTPQPSEIPAESQSRFLANFTLLNEYFSRDHVQFGNVISSATLAAPCVITSADHGLSTGNTVTIYDITGLQGDTVVQWPIDGNSFTITVIDADTFSLNGSNSTSYPPYILGTGNFSSPSYLYGYHKKITYPQPLSRDPMVSSPVTALYPKVFVPAGEQPSRRGDLFFETGLSPNIIDQFTRLFVNKKSNNKGTDYSMVTPWGMTFNFGTTASNVNSFSPFTVTFATPYTTTNFGVIVTQFKRSGSTLFSIAATSVTLTNFLLTAQNVAEQETCSTYYISIGI